jgi:uncharacterized membrane protein YqjE
MIHPFLHLFATRPHLVLEHVEAYGDLAAAELELVSTAWKRTALLSAIAAFTMVLGLVFAGVAIMLWAVTPHAQMVAPWALLAVPLVPLVISLGCILGARRDTGAAAFDNLRRQLRADMDVLREASQS